jgi:hypothetical protein
LIEKLIFYDPFLDNDERFAHGHFARHNLVQKSRQHFFLSLTYQKMAEILLLMKMTFKTNHKITGHILPQGQFLPGKFCRTKRK